MIYPYRSQWRCSVWMSPFQTVCFHTGDRCAGGSTTTGLCGRSAGHFGFIGWIELGERWEVSIKELFTENVCNWFDALHLSEDCKNQLATDPRLYPVGMRGSREICRWGETNKGLGYDMSWHVSFVRQVWWLFFFNPGTHFCCWSVVLNCAFVVEVYYLIAIICYMLSL